MNKLGRDDQQAVVQIGTYNTSQYQNIDGLLASASTSAFTHDTMVRIKSYGGDNWITIGATAVDAQGLLLQENEELHMLVYVGEIISTIGGQLNIVPLGR